jgi:D-alanyl-lipoteichoic acid acyltransferase DltB (MBOAT superfamily)
VRASDFLPQVEERPRLDDVKGSRALFRIATGMFKKLVIADFLSANIIDRVFADPSNYSGLEVTGAVFSYTIQIYYDFSAYSDIAIGTAALFGYVLKENFDKPYLSRNLSEFWRRWHMSLASWLRDYLYIPLGGNRGSKGRTIFNLMVTMVLGGVWHGADWRFVLWGFVHAVGLSLNRIYWWIRGGAPKDPSKLAIVVSTLATFIVVMEVRIVFRARDIEHAWIVFQQQLPSLSSSWFVAANFTPALGLVLAVAVLGHLLPHRAYDVAVSWFQRVPFVVRALLLVALALGIKHVASFEAQPFIYFRF